MNISLTTSVMMMYLFISMEEHVKIIGKSIAVKFIHEAYNLKFINIKDIKLPILLNNMEVWSRHLTWLVIRMTRFCSIYGLCMFVG